MNKSLVVGVLFVLLMATLSPIRAQDSVTFTKTPADVPVIAAGLAGVPVFMADPVVYTDEEGLHLFYTSIFCEKAGQTYFSWNPANQDDCLLVSDSGATGYAFSADRGLTWTFRETPVIIPGPEEWDSEKVETPFVTRVGDTVYLFYCATGDHDGKLFSLRYQIGVATLDLAGRSVKQAFLTDGDVMVKRPAPLLAYNLAEPAADNNVQEPCVVFRDNSFELYFIGLGLALPDQGLDAPGQGIESINFMRATFDADLQPISGPELLNSSVIVNMPEVHYRDGMYYLFYTTFNPTIDDDEFHHGEIVGYATSADGLTWEDGGIILEPGESGAYDDWGLMAPTASFQEDQTILFYSAWGLSDHPAFPVQPDGRFGLPLSEDRTIYSNIGRAISTTPL
ncbi:MAG TPA: hypothetical protein VHP83_17315 [Aggregatilineaceae bacterium]|nr:hypothetical protein [Aggregatilineaceae bacterium]